MEYPKDYLAKSSFLKFLLPLTAGLLFCSTNGIAQTPEQIIKARSYYLDISGNDNNTGTKNNPWKTIEKINSIHLKAGDTLLFKSGQVFNGTLTLDSTDKGVLKKPVLVTSYGKGKAIINGGENPSILIAKTTFITVKKLSLVGAGRKQGNTGDGLSLVNCNNINIDDLEINGFLNAGLAVYGSSFIHINKVYAHDNGFAGISVSGEYQQKRSCSNIYVGYCKADNNPGSPVILDNHSGNGIIAGNCSNLIIEYCTATNNGWDMPRIGNGPVGIWCYEADSVTIQHCISYRNKTSAGGDDGGGFDLDGGVTNSVIQYCLSYENEGSGFGIFQYAGASPWQNNTIRYNISENDGIVSAAHAGIYIWNSSDDSTQFSNCLFYNNTIYNNKGSAIAYARQSIRKGFYFYNNIFVSADSLLKGNRTNDFFLGNNWWNLKTRFGIEGFTELRDWAGKTGQEIISGKVAGLNINPGFEIKGSTKIKSFDGLKFFHRYKLPGGSALRLKGLDLHKIFDIETGGLDFYGRPAAARGVGACF